MIDALIDKLDTFEVVRNAISSILAAEVASQMQLATDGGKDPTLWDLRIFEERSDPWEQQVNSDSDRRPIVNVWFDNASAPLANGNVVSRQQHSGTFNIDCIGFGVASDTVEGHTPGDLAAVQNAQRAIRLVRNILMAADYVYLGLKGLVGRRWVQSIQMFQPQLGESTVQQVAAGRIRLEVMYNELSPQIQGEILQELGITVKRSETGEVYFVAQYP